MPCSLRGSAAPGPGRIRDFCHGLLGEFERRFTEATEHRREAAEQFERRFTEAAEQRREEHGQIIRRLERLDDLHLKPVAEAP